MHYRVVLRDLRSNKPEREFFHKKDDSDLQLKDVENVKQANKLRKPMVYEGASFLSY